MDIQQKVYQLAMALSEYHNDPTNFDRDAAAELVKKSEPKRTMAELRDLYLKDKESQGIRQKSINSQRSRLEVLEDNEWKVNTVKQILQENERTDKTIENWLMTYTTFSNWLKSEHGKELPIPKFKYNKFSGTRDVFTVDELTESEVEQLQAAAGKVGRHQHRDRTMILMAYRHALRCSELVSMRWAMVDLAAGTVHVKCLKGSRDSVQPLSGVSFEPCAA